MAWGIQIWGNSQWGEDQPNQTCDEDDIDGDFTINRYLCLRFQHTNPSGNEVPFIPFFLGVPGLNLRKL